LINKCLPGAWFLRLPLERFPSPPKVLALNNLTVGPGIFSIAAVGEFDGNCPALPIRLKDPQTFDFALPKVSRLRGAGVEPLNYAEGGQDKLVPMSEFNFSIGTRSLDSSTKWVPVAFQEPGQQGRILAGTGRYLGSLAISIQQSNSRLLPTHSGAGC
jgi:hypothetical protein